MKVSIIQPQYNAGENPDIKIAEYLIREMKLIKDSSLILLPEYSNAGGLSDKNAELAALPRAKSILNAASQHAKAIGIFVAVNVLEERNGFLMNSTYLFDKHGKNAFVYDKIHLPPSEVQLGVKRGNGECICEIDGIRFAFMTCYDAYFNEQIEFIALNKPDIILIPGYQRGERVDIIRAQAKLTAFRCNAYVVRASYSMDSDEYGGCSMIVAPDGNILCDIGKGIGRISAEIDEKWKYMRPAGFGGGLVYNDDFISDGCVRELFKT